MKNKSIFSKMDKPLLIMTILYTCIGILLVLSASSVSAVLKYGRGPYYFFIKQSLIYLVSFIVGFLFVLKIPTKAYKALVPMYFIGITSLLLGLLIYGEITNHVKSWIDLGIISIQPSEFIKPALILYFGIFFGDVLNKKSSRFYFLIPIVVSLFIVLLVALQPDYGTAFIIGCIALFTFISIPLKENHVAALLKLIPGAIIIIIMIFLITDTPIMNNMQVKRFIYKDPCTRYTEETGYQTCNGFIAINGGGLFGKGIGNSTQKYLYLPESHTDFIFPIAVEELGVVFGIAIILGYIFILYRILIISKQCYELRNSIICYGIFVYILCHLVINFCGILALMPLTGVPLPFLSYGGSFTINLVLSTFIVQRICIENKTIRKNIEIQNIAK